MPRTTPPRVALVTGATQGIGRAVAHRLAREGFRVGVNGREHASQMAEVVDAVDGFPAPADMADPDAIKRLVADIERHEGHVDALICNAAYMTMHSFVDHPEEDWWKVVDTNLGGSLHAAQAVVPGMRRAGGGSIVLMSSEWGVTGWSRATAYAASKAGLIALAKSLGRELAPENIRVNAIAPGVIDTPQIEVDALDAQLDLAEMKRQYASAIPVGRLGDPEEVAAVVALLARENLGALVGQTIQINGGTTRCRA